MRLPPGQIPRGDFPRFGLPAYADRFPERPRDTSIVVRVLDTEPVVLDTRAGTLPRVRVQADLHCVTTWSHLGVDWGGVRFSDVYQRSVAPLVPEGAAIAGAVFSAQDGYRTTLVLADLMGRDVLLADEIDGAPLPIEHGAPVRLVVPDHYGYKNIKHLNRIDFHAVMPTVKRGVRAFLEHPRARVSKEERGRWIPGSILRYVYRPLIGRTAKRFEAAMQRYEELSESREHG